MLKALQVVALFQGLFLLCVLLMRRKQYRQPTLWLLTGAILTVVFFIIGDDDNNLFTNDVDWFFFDSSLFITFLFLFVVYYVSEKSKFNIKHLLYFIPNALYFFNEVYEVSFATSEIVLLDLLELLIEISFFVYLMVAILILIRSNKHKWVLYFMVPLTLLMSTSILNEVLGWFNLAEIEFFNDTNFHTYTLILVAGLFYFISMKLVIAPKEVLLQSDENKYKSSGLNENLIEEYKGHIVAYMEEEKGYANSKLSLGELSRQLEIPKQYISEILNMHLKTNFQDFVNSYRVEAFVKCLENDQYAHLTLMGIANEVGFNSKSGFYGTFKKHKGLTPSEYKKNLVVNN